MSSILENSYSLVILGVMAIIAHHYSLRAGVEIARTPVKGTFTPVEMAIFPFFHTFMHAYQY